MQMVGLIPALAFVGGTIWVLATGDAGTRRTPILRAKEPIAYWVFVGLGIFGALSFSFWR